MGGVMNHCWHLTKRPVLKPLFLGVLGRQLGFHRLGLNQRLFQMFKDEKKHIPTSQNEIMAVSDARWWQLLQRKEGTILFFPIIMVQWKKWLDIWKVARSSGDTPPINVHEKPVFFLGEGGNNIHQVIQAVTCLFCGWRSLNPWKGHTSPSQKGQLWIYSYTILSLRFNFFLLNHISRILLGKITIRMSQAMILDGLLQFLFHHDRDTNPGVAPWTMRNYTCIDLIGYRKRNKQSPKKMLNMKILEYFVILM